MSNYRDNYLDTVWYLLSGYCLSKRSLLLEHQYPGHPALEKNKIRIPGDTEPQILDFMIFR
jgi:hypothetical protein